MQASVTRKSSSSTVAPRALAGGERRAPRARLLEAFIFYSLLALVALTSIPYGSNEDWWEALFECAVFALTALWIIQGLLAGGWRFPERRLFLPLVALVLFSVLQSVPLSGRAGAGGGYGPAWQTISADAYETRLFALRLLALTFALWILLSYTRSERRVRALIYIVLGIAVASALFGILRQATGGHASLLILPRLKPWEGYAQFVNRNHFAFLMEMALGLVFGLLAGGGVRREQWLVYAGVILPLWTALMLSTSRGGLLSALAELLIVALFWKSFRAERPYKESEDGWRGFMSRLSSSRVVRAALILLLVGGVLLSIVWIGGEPMVSRFETVSGDLESEGRYGASRMEVWRATWKLIESHPFAGSGFGGYWIAITPYHNASGFYTPQRAHNDYLEILAGGGLIGACLAAWFFYELARRMRMRLRSADAGARAASFGAAVGLFGVGLHSIFDFGLHITANALICIVLISIATAHIPPEGNMTKERRPHAKSRRRSHAGEATSENPRLQTTL
ncbi:MAG TPA: O-antigen ligase family protein [Pyrinomonadaceae bacterium]|nr:O-antigen ligase family protein [Pyrinomonadaceae bacterium]